MSYNTKSINVYFNSNGKRLILVYDCCKTYEGNCFEAHDALSRSWAAKKKSIIYPPFIRTKFPPRIDPSQYNRKPQSVTYKSNYDKYLSEKNCFRRWNIMMYNANLFVRTMAPIKNKFQRGWDNFVEFCALDSFIFSRRPNRNRFDYSESDSSTDYQWDGRTKSTETVDS